MIVVAVVVAVVVVVVVCQEQAYARTRACVNNPFKLVHKRSVSFARGFNNTKQLLLLTLNI